MIVEDQSGRYWDTPHGQASYDVTLPECIVDADLSVKLAQVLPGLITQGKIDYQNAVITAEAKKAEKALSETSDNA